MGDRPNIEVNNVNPAAADRGGCQEAPGDGSTIIQMPYFQLLMMDYEFSDENPYWV
jgi:hypothetical protein